jgi:hypothetical protein
MVTPQHTEAQQARHEISHCLYGSMHGLVVDWVRLRPRAEASITIPFGTEDLPRRCREMPHDTAIVVKDIVAMLMAGAAVGGDVIAGRDQAALVEWEEAWSRAQASSIRPGSSWQLICTVTKCDALLWLGQADTLRAIDALARALIREGALDAPRWAKLVAQAMAWRPIRAEGYGGVRAVPTGATAQRSAQAPRALTRGYLPHEGYPAGGPERAERSLVSRRFLHDRPAHNAYGTPGPPVPPTPPRPQPLAVARGPRVDYLVPPHPRRPWRSPRPWGWAGGTPAWPQDSL